MGFLCKIKEGKYLDNPLDRDLGLSNIYNINSETNFCFEPFEGPTYNLSGATKPITGTTTPCSGTPTNCYAVYNLSEIDDFNLTFNFTGSTDYTGYTGNFCYKVYDRKDFTLNQPNKDLNGVNPVTDKCIKFSAITSTTITESFVKGTTLPFTNTDYMLRSYYKFVPKECGNQEIDTWQTSIQTNNFNFDFDWYFITINNPPTPKIITDFTELIDRVVLKQETIPGGRFQNNFTLSQQPIDNKINLYVNGVRISEGLDYIVNTTQFPNRPPVIQVISDNISDRDVISVVYLVGPQNFLTEVGQSRNDLFEIDTFQVTGFTTDVTASTVNIVNNNTTKGTQEVFLTENIDKKSAVVVVVNGKTLLQDVEYYVSTSSDNKIIFNPNFSTIKEGDILSFWYFKTKLNVETDLGTLNSDQITIRWSVNSLPEQRYNTGEFVLEVTEESDTNWTSLFYTNTIEYVSGNNVYDDLVKNLTVGKDFKFRIIFRKNYKNILNEDITSGSEVIGFFNTRNDRIIYGY